jgi:hypothetical protein
VFRKQPPIISQADATIATICNAAPAVELDRIAPGSLRRPPATSLEGRQAGGRPRWPFPDRKPVLTP